MGQTGTKNIAILGSTGSIGRQALDVIRQHPDRFRAVLLAANNSWEALCAQAIEFNADNVVICNPAHYRDVSEALSGHGIHVHSGMQAVCDLVADPDIDIVLTSMVGFSGLRSTVAAVNAGKTIALANKETLVAAGGLVMESARNHGAEIRPVDSEHSAIFQCLEGARGATVEKIHLTASGGPFRTWSRDRIASAGKEQALKHPQWSMGSKITIDSATMMNKGLEVIEAKWLFDVTPEKINVVVHPQSIIHSMVEFADGAVIAQLGHPDMREPIQFALGYPERLPLNNKKLDFAGIGSISFFAPEPEKFPALGLAYEAIRKGGNMPCIMNAANEAAVAAYLHDMIGFYDISDIISDCMADAGFIPEPDLEDIYDTDSMAKALAEEKIKSISRTR